MKKNKTLRLLAITLLLVMIALILVSGTYAKYTSKASGEATARVAKWNFTVGDTKIQTADTFTFDLFETVNDTKDSQTETDVTAANGKDQIIAPGTEGSFDIVLKNESEVSAKYGITYTVTNTSNIPVEYSVDGGKTWATKLDSLNVTADDANTKLAANGGTKTIKVQWKWAYENGKYNDGTEKTADDVYDTTLGTKGTDTITVKAEVTATQVD